MESPAKLVPEFLVTDLARSLHFWCDLIGFRVAYDRSQERFAYLDFDGAQVMLEQYDPADERQWVTGPLDGPLGRGINFQIEVPDVQVIIDRLARAEWSLFVDLEEKWYRTGQRQFLVMDPDGYLLRLAQPLGERPTIPAD